MIGFLISDKISCSGLTEDGLASTYGDCYYSGIELITPSSIVWTRCNYISTYSVSILPLFVSLFISKSRLM